MPDTSYLFADDFNGTLARPTFDIIFAGGGATACVTAGRLAEADPTLKILILETGMHSKDVSEHEKPALYFKGLMTRPQALNFHRGKESEKVGGRSLVTATGRTLGGGSCVNFLAYARAAASDYDDWENVYGNKAWGSKHLIPLLRKAETYQARHTNDTHGKSGPIKISFSKSGHNVATEYLNTAVQYDEDRGPIDDVNGFYACDGYARWARFVDGNTGRRSDAASGYIYPKIENQNLTVMVHKRVVRVVFEGNRATGVEYIDDEDDHSGQAPTPSIAYASKLVVLSAGAFGSAAILERSGIGGSEILHKNGVRQFVDLPGVGEGFMDHLSVFLSYLAADYAEATMDVIVRGTPEEVQPYVDQWLETGQGPMQLTGIDAAAKLRPTAADLEEIGPTFKERWNNYFANAADKPVILTGSFAGYLNPDPSLPKRKYFSMPCIQTYPISRGSTHITSGANPYGALDFDPGYLNDENDLHIIRWVYKHSREIARRMPMYRGEVTETHPHFPPDSDAATGPRDGPVAIDAPKLKYTPEDDKIINEFIRKHVAPINHSSGTCSMKPRGEGGVVSDRLNVYGVNNLKVADLSIIPSMVCGNTYSTVIAIGEKAAVIIAEDLGIKGVTLSD